MSAEELGKTDYESTTTPKGEGDRGVKESSEYLSCGGCGAYMPMGTCRICDKGMED